jgi:hypothetical protein
MATINATRFKEIIDALPVYIYEVRATYFAEHGDGEVDDIWACDNFGTHINIEGSLRQHVRQLVLDLLRLEYPTWADDLGSHGSVVLTPVKRYVDITHNQRLEYYDESSARVSFLL